MSTHETKPMILIATIGLLVGLGVTGCGDFLATDTADQPDTVMGVMQSLKTELGQLSSTYPELAEAGEIEIISSKDGSSHTTAYTKNARFLGKRGYEDDGENACVVALRVQTGEQFQKDVREVAMPAPDYSWANLKLVGWTTLYVGKQPSVGFEARMRKLITDHVAMINELENRAASE